MSVQKLSALTAYMCEQNLVDENQITSWMENGKLMPASKKTGESYLICRYQYDAIFSIEGFVGNSTLLIALISIWLTDNDPTRADDELPAPDMDVDIIDRDSADVEIGIRFREDIYIVANDNGPIVFNGERWELGYVSASVADAAAVGNDQTKETDQPYSYGDAPWLA